MKQSDLVDGQQCKRRGDERVWEIGGVTEEAVTVFDSIRRPTVWQKIRVKTFLDEWDVVDRTRVTQKRVLRKRLRR